MRKKLIIGNWKMHGTLPFVAEYLGALLQGFSPIKHADMVLLPPYVFLADTAKHLKETPIKWGAQNLAAEKAGAYTGEISGEMLAEFGCHYVIVGHSERRTLYHETDVEVFQKLTRAQEAGLTPILCVGESLTEREQELTFATLDRQLALLLQADVQKLEKTVIAYEPIWAIGTGKTASPEQVQAVHAYIRAKITAINADLANKICIIYGGSVKANNAKTLLAMNDIDGALVGGASLNPQEFLEIYRCS